MFAERVPPRTAEEEWQAREVYRDAATFRDRAMFIEGYTVAERWFRRKIAMLERKLHDEEQKNRYIDHYRKDSARHYNEVWFDFETACDANKTLLARISEANRRLRESGMEEV